MLTASEYIEGEEEPLPRACVDMTNTKNKILNDFVIKSCRKLLVFWACLTAFLKWTQKLGTKMKNLKILVVQFVLLQPPKPLREDCGFDTANDSMELLNIFVVNLLLCFEELC